MSTEIWAVLTALLAAVFCVFLTAVENHQYLEICEQPGSRAFALGNHNASDMN